jgi:hypothetical protein
MLVDVSGPAEGTAGPEGFPAGPVAQGPAGTKVGNPPGIQAGVSRPSVQIFPFLMTIMRFLSKNRKKKTGIKFNLMMFYFFYRWPAVLVWRWYPLGLAQVCFYATDLAHCKWPTPI